MTKERISLLFDLDGTLSDPLEGIGRSLNYALAHFGYDPKPLPELGQYIGPPLDQTLRQLTGAADPDHIQALVDRFRIRFGRIGYRENHLYQGIPELLAHLRDKGAVMGVCTAKRRDFAEKIVEMFGLAPFFELVSGGDVGIRKADQIRDLLEADQITEQTIMIGDRAGDITAARENGLRSAGVLWGYGSREELVAARPDWLFDSPEATVGLDRRI